MKMVDKDAREAHSTPCRKSLPFTLMDKIFQYKITYFIHMNFISDNQIKDVSVERSRLFHFGH